MSIVIEIYSSIVIVIGFFIWITIGFCWRITIGFLLGGSAASSPGYPFAGVRFHLGYNEDEQATHGGRQGCSFTVQSQPYDGIIEGQPVFVWQPLHGLIERTVEDKRIFVYFAHATPPLP